MATVVNRRNWLKQSALALAGLSLGNQIVANPVDQPTRPFFPPNGPLRLNANENPYGPSPAARAAMMEAVNRSNRYAWDASAILREKIAARLNVHKDCILLGAGSSEILEVTAQLAAKEKGNAVTANPSFNVWQPIAEGMGMSVTKVPLTGDKKVDLQAMARQINRETRLVYVCNPNNPTGSVVEASALQAFVREASATSFVLLDEAYTDYTDDAPSLCAVAAGNPKVIVAKTFSKIHGMAGARIGFAVGHPDTIKALGELQVMDNNSVSAVSIAGAMASLEDTGFLRMAREKNDQAKAIVYKGFQEMNIPYIPSHTNFVYFSLKNFKGDYDAALQRHNILGGGTREQEGRWTRISIGMVEEMEQYISALRSA